LPVGSWLFPVTERFYLSPYRGQADVTIMTELALHEVRNDLSALRHRAERLELKVAASLIRMAILDIDSALAEQR
jgi:hypothetical protein